MKARHPNSRSNVMEAPQIAIDPPTTEAKQTLPPRLAEAEETIARLNENALAFVRARPVTCVIGALALGFFVGKIAARY
jgi:hypothetical protein